LKAAEEAARAASAQAEETAAELNRQLRLSQELRQELEGARSRGKISEENMAEMKRQLHMTGELNDRLEVLFPVLDLDASPLCRKFIIT
jgi:ABC-type nitrate/sulfonate/bicarbonate transport system substrate-binding protein